MGAQHRPRVCRRTAWVSRPYALRRRRIPGATGWEATLGEARRFTWWLLGSACFCCTTGAARTSGTLVSSCSGFGSPRWRESRPTGWPCCTGDGGLPRPNQRVQLMLRSVTRAALAGGVPDDESLPMRGLPSRCSWSLWDDSRATRSSRNTASTWTQGRARHWWVTHHPVPAPGGVARAAGALSA